MIVIIKENTTQESFDYFLKTLEEKGVQPHVVVGEKQTRPILAGLRDAEYPEEKIYVAESLGDAMNKVYSIETDRRKCVLLENDLPDNY